MVQILFDEPDDGLCKDLPRERVFIDEVGRDEGVIPVDGNGHGPVVRVQVPHQEAARDQRTASVRDRAIDLAEPGPSVDDAARAAGPGEDRAATRIPRSYRTRPVSRKYLTAPG